jgi:hypothetical protein
VVKGGCNDGLWMLDDGMYMGDLEVSFEPNENKALFADADDKDGQEELEITALASADYNGGVNTNHTINSSSPTYSQYDSGFNKPYYGCHSNKKAYNPRNDFYRSSSSS